MLRTASFVLAAMIFAGCAEAMDPSARESAATTDHPCGMYGCLVGRGYECPLEQVVVGFDDRGIPRCSTLAGQADSSHDVAPTPTSIPTPTPAATSPSANTSSNLKVVNVYGTVHDGAVSELKVIVQLSAGAPPLDVEKLMIRYSDGTNAQTLMHDEGTGESSTRFDPTWIRPSGQPTGTTGNSMMEAGHLVELHFVVGTDIQERSSVELSLIPPTGSPVSADFKTPPTYGDDTTVTLR